MQETEALHCLLFRLSSFVFQLHIETFSTVFFESLFCFLFCFCTNTICDILPLIYRLHSHWRIRGDFLAISAMATDGRSAAGTALPCRRRHGQRQQQRPGQEPRHGLWTSLDQDLDLRRTVLLKMILVAHFDAVFASEHNVKYIYIYIYRVIRGGQWGVNTKNTTALRTTLGVKRGRHNAHTHTDTLLVSLIYFSLFFDNNRPHWT